jgi:hypothetical protein
MNNKQEENRAIAWIRLWGLIGATYRVETDPVDDEWDRGLDAFEFCKRQFDSALYYFYRGAQ